VGSEKRQDRGRPPVAARGNGHRSHHPKLSIVSPTSMMKRRFRPIS